MGKIQGQCLCGAIRYTAAAEPLLTAVCHCTHCQKQTGSAFSIVVAVPKGSLVFTAEEPAIYQDVGESGLPVRRRFCPKCGSPIVTEVAAMPTMDFIKAGTLDDTSWLEPQLNIWCDSAQPWVKLDASTPCVPGNPPAA
ncbi:MAG: aldehyde-activating protein [Betaproteobacteria bacterium HGW-Betaproteobacteria-11]|jgi:hypothetical protein|nr:MAG: aldehyde-activating protein [Betaproteobacteria bacterium HGW-Betaproteobacteria-11]